VNFGLGGKILNDETFLINRVTVNFQLQQLECNVEEEQNAVIREISEESDRSC
jgi:hypothetical protein